MNVWKNEQAKIAVMIPLCLGGLWKHKEETEE